MHVIGSVGMGKTYGAAHACYTAVADERPAILLLGSRFHAGRAVETQILDQLDVPRAQRRCGVPRSIRACLLTDARESS